MRPLRRWTLAHDIIQASCLKHGIAMTDEEVVQIIEMAGPGVRITTKRMQAIQAALKTYLKSRAAA